MIQMTMQIFKKIYQILINKIINYLKTIYKQEINYKNYLIIKDNFLNINKNLMNKNNTKKKKIKF